MATKKKPASSSPDAWYAQTGEDMDVVCGTKSVLARNLANFPFPSRLDDNESERIRSIVFDAFNYLPEINSYQLVWVSDLDDIAKKVMNERGILPPYEGKKAGIIFRNDGKLACTVNTDDHLHLCSFGAGLDIDNTTRQVYSVDEQLQHHIQFAASYDYGYLNSSILNSGSGLNVAVKLHLPAMTLLGQIPGQSKKLGEEGFNLFASYGAAGSEYLSGFGAQAAGASLGSYYIITGRSGAGGTELEQIASLDIAVRQLILLERQARKTCKTEHRTQMANFAYRALALAKHSFFVTLRESIEIISGVKVGVENGFLGGTAGTATRSRKKLPVSLEVLNALLYRVQEGHLEYLLTNEKLTFEKDIADNHQKKTERLRALILQEAFENLEV